VLTTDEGTERTVDVQLGSGRTRAQVDGQPVRRAAEAHGVLRVVAFAPEDLALVRGDPADRRRYLDQLLSQRRASYGAALAEYERVLRQRNALLKDLRGRGAGSGTRSRPGRSSSSPMAHRSSRHASRRSRRSEVRSRGTRGLTGSDVPVTLAYRSDARGHGRGSGRRTRSLSALRACARARGEEERRRGVTLVGPHRDELVITLDGLAARTTASQGEAWSVALACKVGSTPLLSEVGDRPVLLLDDVFSELDETRRASGRACARVRPGHRHRGGRRGRAPRRTRIDVRRDDAGATGSTLHPAEEAA
jgi:DNA replication and repair protein RecF